MPDFCSWNGVGWVKAGPWSSGRGTRLEWGTWGLRHWRVANENWGAGGTEWGGDLKRGVASLPSRLQEVWRSVVVSSPIGVHGGATVGNAFWHILGSQNTSDRQKMRFLPSVMRKIDTFVWKQRRKKCGWKSGECLRENWESWALRRCSTKTGGYTLCVSWGHGPLPFGYTALSQSTGFAVVLSNLQRLCI